jgi:hypothetical protein
MTGGPPWGANSMSRITRLPNMFRNTAKTMAIAHDASRKSRAGPVKPSLEVIIVFSLGGMVELNDELLR